MGDEELHWEREVLANVLAALQDLDPDVVLTILDSWPLPSAHDD